MEEHTGGAEDVELLNGSLGDTLLAELFLAFGLVEQTEDSHAVLVVDGAHHIHGLDVVHPGNVLVADTCSGEWWYVFFKEKFW